jgi:hypothetical protein
MQTKESDQNPESNTISAVVNALAAEADNVNNQRSVQIKICTETQCNCFLFFLAMMMIARV